MKAIGYYASTPGNALLDLDVPPPEARPNDVIVRVKAVSINPADHKIRERVTPEGNSFKILGFDASGIVESVGSAASLFKPGDEVFYAGDMTRDGTNAELHAVDERVVGFKPKSLDWAQAAAMPLTSLAAWEVLFDRLKVPYGNMSQSGTLLIINGAGGVGSILIQIASLLTGLKVVATASRPETVDWVKQMGAHHVIDHHRPFRPQLEALGIGQVEYVVGLTGTDKHLPQIYDVIAPQGHVGVVDDSPSFDIASFQMKAVSFSWELMFVRPMFATSDILQQHKILNQVSRLVDGGLLKSTMTSFLGPINAANLTKVYELSGSGKSIGKTVLEGFE
ncbi:zinc-binding alcohol dehydrogenase family protein [Ochrobactrum soli]|uniref:Zinc-type alcohol dehydrogenase-like protein n=1 Tax=Ochrobactrum soli TaxID=2448455 RepID=A0A2P9HEA9_9HYPH|nr:zinc-binding alcohol dehydrogenase family protein [[Ochrobactrum] soli]SPL62437.1 Bifunctional protein: zinc-containing alcohol dehydrogenase; quinone oxidoreductase (NADPH:quinone reductase); Similar to arginate lyase [[Ochrobactrum] soli]